MVRVLPSISLAAFYVGEATGETLRQFAATETMRRVRCTVSAGGVAAAVEFLRSEPRVPDVLIVELEGEIDIERLRGQLERIASAVTGDRAPDLFVIGSVNDVALYKTVQQVGGSDYLVAPIQADEVSESLARHYREEAGRGEIVAVLGSRGGAGTSTFAAALWWALGARTEQRTLLVDMGVPFGSLATLLDLRIDGDRGRELYDPQRLDASMLQAAIHSLDKSAHLHVLPTLPDLERRVIDGVEARGNLLSLLREEARFCVLDLPFAWSASLEQTLTEASHVFLVVTPDFVGVQQAQAILKRLADRRRGLTSVRMVLNKAGLPGEWSAHELTKALGAAPIASIKYDAKAFCLAATNGFKEADNKAAHNHLRPVCAAAVDVILGQGATVRPFAGGADPARLTGISKAMAGVPGLFRSLRT